MVSSGEPPRSWDSADVVDVRAEARDVVGDALLWRMNDARWEAIAQVLAAMDEALAAGDLDALAAATADLELVGPLRITRIGATPVVPPPPPILYRLNRLMHVLGDTVAAQRNDGEDGGTGDDDACSH
jgi:hypothetical protein